jgi:hypothetical protein
MVWAVDNLKNIYAREAIYFPELPIGTTWVLVPPIECSDMAIRCGSSFTIAP